MRSDELDFHLPPELIAQTPPIERPQSRLLHYQRNDRSIGHLRFRDLPSLLRAGDLLVFNDARVTPARFTLLKPTGGRVDGLFLGQTEPQQWRVLLRNLGTVHPDSIYRFDGAPDIEVRVMQRLADGECLLRVDTDLLPAQLLDQIGRMPLPPYIHRGRGSDERDSLDRDRYQTVYAATPGSIAAPTAGLHFDQSLLAELDRHGVIRATLTLHVGMGTFKPVTADDLEKHTMHVERYAISGRAAEALNSARRDGRRIVAVGTTTARVLESQPEDGFREVVSETGIFIYPPYRWRHVGALVTNFHLPRSTLIALVAALTGLDEQRRIYATAIAERYRFFSYGDAMFIE